MEISNVVHTPQKIEDEGDGNNLFNEGKKAKYAYRISKVYKLDKPIELSLLKEKFNLPIDFIDERLTTVEAERMLVEQADASRKKRKKVIDKLAASLILQNYLDAKGKLLKELN